MWKQGTRYVNETFSGCIAHHWIEYGSCRRKLRCNKHDGYCSDSSPDNIDSDKHNDSLDDDPERRLAAGVFASCSLARLGSGAGTWAPVPYRDGVIIRGVCNKV